MSFPLAEWIDVHAACRYNLGISGMIGAVPVFAQRFARNDNADPEELRRRLARVCGVATDRLFLTHGASEANSLALIYLARKLTRRFGRAPRCQVSIPEYPPLRDTPGLVGFQLNLRRSESDVTVFSNPHNPTGRRPSNDEIWERAQNGGSMLVDETFREFTGQPSTQQLGMTRLWTSGTFTKFYGADAIRVGFVVCPEDDVPLFGRFHGLLLDELPPASVAAALGILDHRTAIQKIIRTRFQRNLRCLRKNIAALPKLDAPLWFDRGEGELDGNDFARAALSSSVLVCPGSYFGDPTGVRVTLTRRSFPRDLDAYLGFRSAWLNQTQARGGRTTRGVTKR